MGEVKSLSRGDGNRNRRSDQLRERVPTTNVVLGIDLADRKQVAALVDHDASPGPSSAGVPSVAARRAAGLGDRDREAGGLRVGDGGL